MKKNVLKAIGVMMSAVMVLGCTACGASGESAPEVQTGETTAQDSATEEETVKHPIAQQIRRHQETK